MPSLVEIQRQWPDKMKALDRMDERIAKLEECLGSDRLDMLHEEVSELVVTVNRLNDELKKAADDVAMIRQRPIEGPGWATVFVPKNDDHGDVYRADVTCMSDNITAGGSSGDKE